ncbi:MAG TPA: glycosyltransferase family 2 protein [Vicinamibacterales bacterium]|nr:glycosyltransferase family 2 protein [Vicinamibacterales bacterium]
MTDVATAVAIVPAFNEAVRLPGVLDVLTSCPSLHDVLVVDDGSTDATADVARAHGARVLRLATNLGKGAAMERGVSIAPGDIVFFCDADVFGLTHQLIDDLIDPVREGRVAMSVALYSRHVYRLRPALRLVPMGGTRALKRDLWTTIPPRFKRRFRIETALNYYATQSGRGLESRVAPGLGHTIKERKYGMARGLAARGRMYWDVGSTFVRLRLRRTSEVVSLSNGNCGYPQGAGIASKWRNGRSGDRR